MAASFSPTQRYSTTLPPITVELLADNTTVLYQNAEWNGYNASDPSSDPATTFVSIDGARIGPDGVQAEGASEGCRIIESRGRTGRYAALSHCCGGMITPVLSDETIGDFLEDLPVSQLAANFQDTVMITRELRIRYLWIDSVCIIQGSNPDWQVESAEMAAVYQNAAVTICAATSPGSKHGILPQKDSSSGGQKLNKVSIAVDPKRR